MAGLRLLLLLMGCRIPDAVSFLRAGGQVVVHNGCWLEVGGRLQGYQWRARLRGSC